MKYKKLRGFEIEGDLDAFIANYDEDGEKWEEILIHGNPEGLRSFAKLLIEIADLNQEKVNDKYLPIGAREHYELRPGFELSKNSVQVVVGRLDAKGNGKYHDGFIEKNKR